jgi:sulfatase maturation enzyme AslB (radical SAM superfamily)
MKIRRSGDGIHAFDRTTGLNVLFDEVRVPRELWSPAPRFVSIALTNVCDLECSFCYAPKKPATLPLERVVAWARELDSAGCLGVGFGGGEPTLYARFASLCQLITGSTQLAVSFTTHAHRLTSRFRDELACAVQFVRVSMDGVNQTYERIRGRSFGRFRDQLRLVADICPFGINYVINDDTIGDLDAAKDIILEAGARELLLLPERSKNEMSEQTRAALRQWVAENSGDLPLSITEASSVDGIPIAEPFVGDKGLRAYAHVNAFGAVSGTSFEQGNAVPIKDREGILASIAAYERIHP